MSDNPFAPPAAPPSARSVSPRLGWTALFFSFHGRIRRRTYWLATIASSIGFYTIMFAVLAGGAWLELDGSAFLASVSFGVLVIFTWSTFAVQAKRWHDRGKSTGWVLLQLVPGVGVLWTLIECGFLAGTPGPNRFGPGPKGYSAVAGAPTRAVSATEASEASGSNGRAPL